MKSGLAFKSLLLFDVDLADKVDSFITDISLMYVLPVFFLAVIWEILGDNNVTSVGKSLVLSLLMIFTFSTFYKASVDYSFNIAAEIIKDRGGNKNSFMRSWKEVFKEDSSKKSAPESKFFKAIEIISGVDDVVLSFVSILVFGALLLTSVFYTLGYYFNYIFIGIAALIGILPITRTSLISPIKGLLWSSLVPIVCATIIALMGSLLEFKTDSSGKLAFDLKTYVEVGVLALSMLFVLPGVYLFLNGKTMGEIASSMAPIAGMSLLYTGGKLSSKVYMKGLSNFPLHGPIKEFSKIAAGSFKMVADRNMKDFRSPSLEKKKDSIPKIFSRKVKQDIDAGGSPVAALLNPKNHIGAVSERTQNIKENIQRSRPVTVFKNVKQSQGTVKAVKAASFMGAYSLASKVGAGSSEELIHSQSSASRISRVSKKSMKRTVNRQVMPKIKPSIAKRPKGRRL